MLIEPDGFTEIQLGVGEQAPLCILPRGDFEDSLRGYSLVDMQRNRLTSTTLRVFPLAGPFQPMVHYSAGLPPATASLHPLNGPRRAFSSNSGRLVRFSAGVKTQHGRQVGIIFKFNFSDFFNLPLRRQPGRWDILAWAS